MIRITHLSSEVYGIFRQTRLTVFTTVFLKLALGQGQKKTAEPDEGQEDNEGPQLSQQWTVISATARETFPFPEGQDRE